MQALKQAGALLTFLCVAAVCLCGTAFAANQPEVLPNTATTYTGANVGIATLSTLSGVFVECKTATGAGTLAAGGTSGTFKIDFKECKTSAGVCTGLGEASGVILSTGNYKLVFDKVTEINKVLGSAILFEPTETHFNCTALILALLKGQVLCLILAPETKAKSHEFHCTQVEIGHPNETEYYKTLTAKGEFVEPATKITELLLSTNGATPVTAALLALGTIE